MCAGSLGPYFRLSEQGKLRFGDALVPLAEADRPWVMAHSSWQRRAVYGEEPFPPPSQWLIRRKHRRVLVEGGRHVPIEKAVGHGLKDFAPFFWVAVGNAEFLGLPQSLDKLSATQWSDAFRRATATDDATALQLFYGQAALAGSSPVPALVRCIVGPALENRPPAKLPPPTASASTTC